MADLKLTLIQSSLVWEDIEANIQNFTKKIDEIQEETDIIILPEMFNTGYTMNSEKLGETMDGKTVNWMKKTAEQTHSVIVGSLIIKENQKHFNRLIWMKPDHSYEYYDKRHLFRFAGEDKYYTAGNRRVIVEHKGWKILLLICFDLRYPVWIRNKNEEYDLIICNANWPEPRNNAWKTLLEARAHENQTYVAGLNRIGKDGNDISFSGDSAVIDPKGKKLTSFEPHEEKTETISLSMEELNRFRKKFPVSMDADDFELKG
ncbi:MAG: amidohydrolase [Flavobacteriales bacterium]